MVGCPVRFSISGVGGSRLLVMTSEPATWQLWCTAKGNHRNMKFCSLAEADKRRAPLDSLSRRARQKPSGGSRFVYLSTFGLPHELPLTWREATMESSDAGPSFVAPTDEEGNAQRLKV